MRHMHYFKKDGAVRPTGYIADWTKRLSNIPVAGAVGKLFADAEGKMKPYKKADLDYDIACGWIAIWWSKAGAGEDAAEGHCSVAETLKEHSDVGQASTMARLREAGSWATGCLRWAARTSGGRWGTCGK